MASKASNHLALPSADGSQQEESMAASCPRQPCVLAEKEDTSHQGLNHTEVGQHLYSTSTEPFHLPSCSLDKATTNYGEPERSREQSTICPEGGHISETLYSVVEPAVISSQVDDSGSKSQLDSRLIASDVESGVFESPQSPEHSSRNERSKHDCEDELREDITDRASMHGSPAGSCDSVSEIEGLEDAAQSPEQPDICKRTANTIKRRSQSRHNSDSSANQRNTAQRSISQVETNDTKLGRKKPDQCKRKRTRPRHHPTTQSKAPADLYVSDLKERERPVKRLRHSDESQMSSVRHSRRSIRSLEWKASQGRLAISGYHHTGKGLIPSREGERASPVKGAAVSSPLEFSGEEQSVNRCTLCGISRETLIGVTKRALASDELFLTAIFERSGGLSSDERGLLAIRSCLSIIHNHITLSASTSQSSPGLAPLASAKMVDDISQELGDDGLTDEASTEDEEIDERSHNAKISEQQLRRRWDPLEERQLTAYRKENKKISWIATKLARTESAVSQHWRIMNDD
ncbi:hypothetical protein F5X98DRAFT_79428 [Xylaria grammica]|nr:hypothetical protein F5X98DRAFT_79428 [Xylaria grammica]